MWKEVAYQISKRRIKSRATEPPDEAGRLSSSEGYLAWRERALSAEFNRYFTQDLVRGKDILDFGCGTGALSYLLAHMGAKSCVGIDLLDRDIEVARGRAKGEPVAFKCATSTNKVDMASESVDVITCFDVMEHIMEYESILKEWHRVLRPNGRVLISWQPWLHPYGHHAEPWVPVPWAHVLLTEREIDEVCARVVDLPEFNAPYWDFDAQGNRINRFREGLKPDGADKRGSFLNGLTMRRFERLCGELGFSIENRTLASFQGPSIVRSISAILIMIPGVREFFTANAAYTLRRLPM